MNLDSSPWATYKRIVIIGFILGMFVFYIRFLKESEAELRKEGFDDANSNATDKIRGILKRTDQDLEQSQERTQSIRKVRFLASETAEEWSIVRVIDRLVSNITKTINAYFVEIFRLVAVPWIHRVERIFT